MIYVNSISVSPRSITLKKGTWYYGISAEVCPLNADCRSVTWSSSNTNVATVNASNGYIYAKAAGTANITATAIDGSGCRDSITVTVSSTVSVQSVSLNRTSITLEEGDCTTLSATVLPTNATNRAVTWSSNRTNVATVNGGNVFAVKKGTANITATAADGSGKSASCTVTVTDDTLVKSITVHPSNKEMVTGKSAFFSATVCPVNATDRCVIWSSSCPDIATVNPISGLVYAKRKGSATIIAEARDGSGVCGCCALTVTDPICVEDITLNRSSMTLYKGNSYRLSATVCPDNATNKTVRWCSSRTSVATVNTYTGRVTAKSAGITTVYAIAQDGSGVSACCTVHVRQTVLCCAEETPKNKRNRTPVDVYSGAHVLQNTLISLFGGQNLGLIAHYNSTNLACGDLGSGWYHNFEKHLEVYGSVIYVYSSPSIYALYRTKSNCHNVYTCASPNRNGYVLTVDYACPYP